MNLYVLQEKAERIQTISLQKQRVEQNMKLSEEIIRIIRPFFRLQDGWEVLWIIRREFSRQNWITISRRQTFRKNNFGKTVSALCGNVYASSDGGRFTGKLQKHMDAFQFIKDVAADWDDTKILSAEPGDYIITARKAKGTENWFVGGITDENKRDYTVDFSFLDKGKNMKQRSMKMEKMRIISTILKAIISIKNITSKSKLILKW
jgi:hypothetical protein